MRKIGDRNFYPEQEQPNKLDIFGQQIVSDATYMDDDAKRVLIPLSRNLPRLNRINVE